MFAAKSLQYCCVGSKTEQLQFFPMETYTEIYCLSRNSDGPSLLSSIKRPVCSCSSLSFHLFLSSPPVTLKFSSPAALSSPPCHCSWVWHSSSFPQWSACPPEAPSVSSPSPRFILKLWVSRSSVSFYLPLLSPARLIYLSLNRQSEGQIKTWNALRQAHKERRGDCGNKPSWFLVAQTVWLQHRARKFPEKKSCISSSRAKPLRFVMILG